MKKTLVALRVWHLIFGLICLLSLTMEGESKMSRVIQGNNKFGLDVYKILARDGGNIFMSPLSAHIVLSMAYQGAGGSTAQQMSTCLGLPDAKTVADEYQQIIGAFKSVKSCTLDIANKIYLNNNFTLQSDFKQVIENKFLAEAQEINFAENVKAAKVINDWVEEKTKNKIKELIQSDMLDSLTRLVLVNAVYFKGNWAKKFDKENTKKEPFYLLDGSEATVDMMHLNGKFRYHENKDLDCKILELPYEGHELSMVIFLPNDRAGVQQLQEKLNKVNLFEITQQMRTWEVNVALPRFTLESTLPMSKVLQEMGLTDMFSPTKANFSKISTSDEQLYVSSVIQKAFIEVNEEGSEAAAATDMVYMRRSNDLEMTFDVNCPFILFILYKRQIELFAGNFSPEKIELIG